jgi:hypothetical protein
MGGQQQLSDSTLAVTVLGTPACDGVLALQDCDMWSGAGASLPQAKSHRSVLMDSSRAETACPDPATGCPIDGCMPAAAMVT